MLVRLGRNVHVGHTSLTVGGRRALVARSKEEFNSLERLVHVRPMVMDDHMSSIGALALALALTLALCMVLALALGMAITPIMRHD
jgi:hypothetical protein